MRVSVPAFGKINLWLEILGRRADGFHEIRTLFQSLDFHDLIDIETHEGVGIALQVEGREVPRGRENLVIRAAEIFSEGTGFKPGLHILLHKRLPVGSGLGGGSSDAAATLAGLNRLSGDRFTRGELSEMGARIGSDVPFFLWGGTAFGSGRGELVRPLPDAGLEEAILVVWPGFPVSAARAYEALEAPLWQADDELTSRDPDTTIREFFSVRDSGRWGALRNDLESPVTRLYPELNRLKQFLLEGGCREALLAGSGSSVFGMGEPATLRKAAQKCRDSGWRDTFLCRPLSSAEYCRRWAASGICLND